MDRLEKVELAVKSSDPLNAGLDVTKALREYQISMLLKLRHLRETLKKEESNSVASEKVQYSTAMILL